MTTERVLPAVSLPIPAARGARPDLPRSSRPALSHEVASQTRRRAREATGTRSQPFLTMPARAGMLVGATAAVYAVSLAAVAGLQAMDDVETAALRQPYLDEVVAARATNDALETRLRDADSAARALAAAYGDTVEDVAAFQARLDSLAALVAEVEGSAAALPDRIRLPSVSMRGPVGSSRSSSGSRPATTTSSGGSGG
jgi:hypothetical protein